MSFLKLQHKVHSPNVSLILGLTLTISSSTSFNCPQNPSPKIFLLFDTPFKYEYPWYGHLDFFIGKPETHKSKLINTPVLYYTLYLGKKFGIRAQANYLYEYNNYKPFSNYGYAGGTSFSKYETTLKSINASTGLQYIFLEEGKSNLYVFSDALIQGGNYKKNTVFTSSFIYPEQKHENTKTSYFGLEEIYVGFGYRFITSKKLSLSYEASIEPFIEYIFPMSRLSLNYYLSKK